MKHSTEPSQLFRDSIGKVQPIAHDKIITPRKRIKRKPKLIPEMSVIAKDFNVPRTEPVQSDSLLNFSRAGVQPRQLRNLQKGNLICAAECDLHGLTLAQAEQTLEKFVQECQAKHYRVIRIIHGKGHRSENNNPTLKNFVNQWLRELKDVLAFYSAMPKDGGAGSVQVLLRNIASEKE